jgi:hypothetical protein
VDWTFDNSIIRNRSEESFKDEPVNAAAAGPVPSAAAAAKEDTGTSQNDGEFGGLVSYFSSQQGDDDLDT